MLFVFVQYLPSCLSGSVWDECCQWYILGCDCSFTLGLHFLLGKHYGNLGNLYLDLALITGYWRCHWLHLIGCSQNVGANDNNNNEDFLLCIDNCEHNVLHNSYVHYKNIISLISLILSIPELRRSFGHHRWFRNHFSSFFPVLHCPLGLGKLQACPFPDVVFSTLRLSALS